MPDSNRVHTGIAGLDRIFLGGVRRGNLILVAGSPGSGKSLLGIEFIYRGITASGEPGLIVVFESDLEMIAEAQQFSSLPSTRSRRTSPCSMRMASSLPSMRRGGASQMRISMQDATTASARCTSSGTYRRR